MKILEMPNAISNREFLETYAGSARIGLCGGNDLINKAIRKMQWQVTLDGRRSPWSHAFLFSERRSDGEFWVLESDLDLRHKQIRLGVQENRMSKYFDENEFPNLAVIDFDLTAEQSKAVLTEALNLLSGLSTYSLTELLGTLIAMSRTGLRAKENLLHVLEHLAQGADPAAAALAVRAAREAALADEAGKALDATLVQHGAPPRPVKEQPIRFVRKLKASLSS